jgi:outer membrane lipoprotein-sorting protein
MNALVLAVALASPSAAPAPESRYDPEALTVLAAMSEAVSHVDDYTMLLVKRELRGREMDDEETLAVKWQRPQRIYLREIEGPREGQEVLYATGWNKNRIKVHRGSFPAITVNLDPYGTLAMAHAHHAVPDVSLVRFVDLVEDNVRRARAKGFGTAAVVGHEILWGRPATRLELTTPPTGSSPTLAKGQTLWDIARATGQDMYVILHANRARHWRQADHPEAGDAVIVPEFYASRLVLWVDDALHLPLQADLYDHEGSLYEHYEHRDLAVNVGLKPVDFDPKNPAYHF